MNNSRGDEPHTETSLLFTMTCKSGWCRLRQCGNSDKRLYRRTTRVSGISEISEIDDNHARGTESYINIHGVMDCNHHSIVS